MFDNAGSKIKSAAKTLFWIFAVLNIIGFIILVSERATNGLLLFLGFWVILLISYLSSLLLAGFGELIETATEIRDSLYEDHGQSKVFISRTRSTAIETKHEIISDELPSL